MMMPSIFTRSLFDDVFDAPFFARDNSSTNLMKTDVRETETGYTLDVDLPGVKKDDVKLQLKNGYLTIAATTSSSNDTKDEDGHYIRRERYNGSYSRSFYVGTHVKEEDVKARFENGILTVSVPKKEAKPQVKEEKYISIEG